MTRLSIENRNLKMRVESLNTRLDFSERRARALEGVVQYKQGASPVSLTTLEPVANASLAPEEADKAGRRRRRRRGRRGAGSRVARAAKPVRAATAARTGRPTAASRDDGGAGEAANSSAGDGGADPAQS